MVERDTFWGDVVNALVLARPYRKPKRGVMGVHKCPLCGTEHSAPDAHLLGWDWEKGEPGTFTRPRSRNVADAPLPGHRTRR